MDACVAAGYLPAMFPVALPLVLVVVGGIAYHLALKASSGGSPWAVLAVAYGLAFAVCVGLWLRGGHVTTGMGRGVIAVAAVLGLALVAIEGGYLLAYRSGFAMGSVASLSNTAIVIGLMVVGAAVLGESLTAARIAGVGLAALGAWLVVR